MHSNNNANVNNVFLNFVLYLLILLLSVLILPSQLFAQMNSEKVSKKTSQRWTLQEWLEQKNRNMLMDQWLMMHTPSPYEFIIDYTVLNYTVKDQTHNNQSSGNQASNKISFTAYATFVGIEYQQIQWNTESILDKNLLFHVRLFGSSDQSSHLTLNLGQRQRNYLNQNLPTRSQYMGATDLTVYFNHHFGIKGELGQFVPLSANPQFGDVTGKYSELNLFLDFDALRFSGGIYNEEENQALNNTSQSRSVFGSQFGIRLYF